MKLDEGVPDSLQADAGWMWIFITRLRRSGVLVSIEGK